MPDQHPLNQNTTNPGTLSQLGSLSDAFSGSDFSTISLEEYQNDPLAGKIMAILYTQSEKEKIIAKKEASDLKALIKFYQSIPTANIAFAIINVLGTIVIGIGVSLDFNWWLVIIGGILVILGNIMPFIVNKMGEKY